MSDLTQTRVVESAQRVRIHTATAPLAYFERALHETSAS
jgi:hypothetical protein